MYKFMPDTPARKVISEFDHKNCTEAIQFHINKGTTTAMEMAQAITNESWVMWDLVNLGEDTHPDIRRVLIDKITTPLKAYILYHRLDWLTEEEHITLEAKFANLDSGDREIADRILGKGDTNG